MKKIMILILSLITLVLLNSQRRALIPYSQEKAYQLISDLLERELPKNIEILVYLPIILNDDIDSKIRMIENFKLILSSQGIIRHYKLHFIDQLLVKNPEVDQLFLEKATEEELKNLAKLFNFEAVLMTNITLLDKTKKKIFDKKKRMWVRKNIALIQGNVFIVNHKTPVIRFAYYFLID